MIRIYNIARHERGLLFRGDDFVRVLRPGWHVYLDPLLRLSLEREDTLDPRIESLRLDVVLASDGLGVEAAVVDLSDDERALVWVDGRLSSVLEPGRHAFWTVTRSVRIERVSLRKQGDVSLRFEHDALSTVAALGGALDLEEVAPDTVALFFQDGVLQATLGAGRYAFWRSQGRVELRSVDLREQVLDVNGQEIMTEDKVTLRLNAVLTYKVDDPVKSVTLVSEPEQSIYREVQLALRAVVGTRSLDSLLEDKDAVVAELSELVAPRLEAMGFRHLGLGIRDIILPGEMRQLLNQVTEARKAAEANLITRREETAAVRSQLNAARLLESNPTLMRLRELEVLEKVAEKSNLNVVVGEGGLADRVVKLL